MERLPEDGVEGSECFGVEPRLGHRKLEELTSMRKPLGCRVLSSVTDHLGEGLEGLEAMGGGTVKGNLGVAERNWVGSPMMPCTAPSVG